MLIFFWLDGVDLDGVPPTFARAGAKNSQNGVFRRIWAREVSFDLILRGGARGTRGAACRGRSAVRAARAAPTLPISYSIVKNK